MKTHAKAAGSPKGYGDGDCPECGAPVKKHDLAGRIEEAHVAGKDETGGDLGAKIAALIKKGMPKAMAETVAKKQIAKKGNGSSSKKAPPWVKESALPGFHPCERLK